MRLDLLCGASLLLAGHRMDGSRNCFAALLELAYLGAGKKKILTQRIRSLLVCMSVSEHVYLCPLEIFWNVTVQGCAFSRSLIGLLERRIYSFHPDNCNSYKTEM